MWIGDAKVTVPTRAVPSGTIAAGPLPGPQTYKTIGMEHQTQK